MDDRLNGPYAPERPLLLAQARKLCKGAPNADDLAEDLVQMTLLFHHEKYRNGRPPEEKLPLLFTILTHVLIDDCRRRKRRKETPLSSESEGVVALEPEEEPRWTTINSAQFQEAVEQSLTETLRQTVDLYRQGMRNKDIARALGTRDGNVAKRLHDARARLRKYFRRDFD